MKTVLRVQEFEDRLVPTVAIDSGYEAFSWVVVNTLRQNPTAFANNLQGLINGTVDSAFGFSKTDPVIADLKVMIGYAAYPANLGASLSLMRSTAPAGPLAWEETLENRAGVHNDWMKVNGFAHTGTTGTRTAIPGYTKDDSAPPDVWGYSGQYSWWGENIGYGYGFLRSTKSAYNTGAITLTGLEQRAAFLDTAAYMLELNSSSFGHLKNLLGRDSGSGGIYPTFNAIGIDTDLYEAPSGYEVKDGVPEAFVSTHRFGLYRPNGSGGFIAGIAYTDRNLNGYFDADEGAVVTVNVRDASGNGFTDTLTADNFGAFTGYVANGTYTVTVSSGATVFSSRTVTVNNSNAWAGFELGGIGRPTLTGPTGSQTTIRPTVAWTATGQATGYEVRIDDLTGRTTNLFNNAPASGTSWTVPADLVSGRLYRVWVRGVANGSVGEWSESKDFSVAVPDQYGPVGMVREIRPTFSWGAVAGTTAYAIRVTDLTTMRADIFPGATASGTSWQPPGDLVSGRKYTWQVRAMNAQGLGAWSPAATFAVGLAAPTGPATGVADLRPAFTFNGVGGATAYDIVVNDYTGLVGGLFRARVTGTSWNPPADLVSGRTYTWQVRAVNALGLGRWSPLKAFVVGRPTELGPSGDVDPTRPTFAWTAIAGAAQYQVQIDDVTAGRPAVVQAKVSSTNFVPGIDLATGHIYRWRVRALNASGLGCWCLSTEFRIV